MAGITNDKAAAAHGKPTEITQPRSLGDIMKRLERLGVLERGPQPIDAEVVQDAELEEPTKVEDTRLPE